MPKAQDGDKVTVVFEATLDDGSVFDTSDEQEPMSFVLGDSEVLPGLEKAVSGMEVGEQKVVTIPPEEGYGLHQERLVEEVDVSALPSDLDLRVGNQLEVTAEDGNRFHLLIIERKEDKVILDGNHPLAGQSLTFQIEVTAIDRPTIN